MNDEHPWSGVIAVEGRRSVDGRLIHSSGLTWKTLPIALIRSEDWSIIGRVETIERVPTGEDGAHLIRAAGVSYGAALEPGTPTAITCSELERARIQGSEADFRSGVVRAVYLGTLPAWPECKIDG